MRIYLSIIIGCFLTFSSLVEGSPDAELHQKCNLFKGGFKFDGTQSKCVFQTPKMYCTHYLYDPVLIKMNGMVLACFAGASCQEETCQWVDGKRTDRCNKKNVRVKEYPMICPHFNGQCPKDPTVCARAVIPNIKMGQTTEFI